jgi:hypothetical protein
VCDVEKLIVEARMLNARSHEPGVRPTKLPSEETHCVGQNPSHGSSIKETLHSQIGRVDRSALLSLECEPQFSDELEAGVDVVQVGTHEDAFIVKFTSTLESYSALVTVLQELRVALMRKFGSRKVDCLYFIVPGDSDFTVALTVIGQIEGDRAKGKYNIDTGESVSESPASTLGVKTALGYCSYNSEAQRQRLVDGGREALAKAFDVFRKPGARRFVRQFLLARLGILDSGRPVLVSAAGSPSPHNIAERPSVFAEPCAFEGVDALRSLEEISELADLSARE